jgi:hypothetical protein
VIRKRSSLIFIDSMLRIRSNSSLDRDLPFILFKPNSTINLRLPSPLPRKMTYTGCVFPALSNECNCTQSSISTRPDESILTLFSVSRAYSHIISTEFPPPSMGVLEERLRVDSPNHSLRLRKLVMPILPGIYRLTLYHQHRSVYPHSPYQLNERRQSPRTDLNLLTRVMISSCLNSGYFFCNFKACILC